MAKLQSVNVRLGLLVALVVALVVSVSTYLEIRVFEASMLADLVDTASKTAQAVADDVELRPDPLDVEDLADGLREFIDAVPSIRAISVVVMENGNPTVLASTSTVPGRETLSLAQQAIKQAEDRNEESTAWGPDTELLRTVAVSANRDDQLFGAVVLTFSVASVEQLHRRGGLVVLWFVPAAILVLTLLLELLVRRLIHRPIAAIHSTMERVGDGDLGARAPVMRQDEIGAVAAGLNQMLATMENFNVALKDRVRDATEELRARNAELVDSYSRVFALREALGRAQQMAAVGHMAASVAHQIGTPLNLISGYVQMLMEEEGPDSRATRRLQIVAEQIEKVTGIVRTMLDHARQPTSRQPTDLVQLVERVCAVARPKLDALSVELEMRVEGTIPLVEAESVQLELAFLNLVTNSLDAMPGGGRLTVTVSPTGTGARIEVADTGPGIPPDLLPRIFEPWVTTKPAGHGTGLGLSITRDVIAGHGGSITARSEPGAGASFAIELPASPGVAAPAEAESS